MGNNWKNSEKSKEDVENDILIINQITRNYLFMKKTKLYMFFSLLNDNFLTNLSKSKIIKSEIFDFKDNLIFKNKDVYLTLNEFYIFFNCLTNSTQLFYGDLLKSKLQNNKKSSKDIDENDDLCPICEENKVCIMLDCYHFFCEKCIKTWLFDKKNNCPLCRYEIKINKDNNEILKSKQWDVIDINDEKDMEKDISERFYYLLDRLFMKKK